MFGSAETVSTATADPHILGPQSKEQRFPDYVEHYETWGDIEGFEVKY